MNCIYWTFNIQNLLQNVTNVITFPNKHTQNTSVPALLKLVSNKIQTLEHPLLCHPLERDELTYKAYNLHNSLAFKEFTSQTWKYYGIFGFVRMREVGYTSISQTVECTSFSQSMWEMRSESALFSGLCFQRTTHDIAVFCWRLSNSVALLQAPPSGLGVNCLYSS